MSLEFIFAEAAKTLGQAIRITFILFWWLGLGIAAVYRQISEQLQENQIKGFTFTVNGKKSHSTTCASCGATNEARTSHCFSCGARL